MVDTLLAWEKLSVSTINNANLVKYNFIVKNKYYFTLKFGNARNATNFRGPFICFKSYVLFDWIDPLNREY